MGKILILLCILPLVSLQQTYIIRCVDKITALNAPTEYYECIPGDSVTYKCNHETTIYGEIIGNGIFEKIGQWDTCRNQTTQLELIDDGITALTKWDLVGYPNLKVLNLSQNMIQTIGVNAFDCINQLTALNLSHNEISHLESDVISWLQMLENLDLSFNRLTTIEGYALDGLRNLKQLDLSNNIIIDARLSFINLRSLERLNLSHNALSDFNFDNFRDNVNIEILDLSHNQLRGSAKPVMFEGLTNLRYLDLSHNLIFRIESGSFAGLDLFYFDISENPLTGNLSADSFAGLKSTHLDLSTQNISHVSDWAFRGSAWITHLNLSWNRITELEKDSLRTLTSLEQLDLSGNNLLKFDADPSDLTALLELNLSYNEIGNIKFDGTPTLVDLDLSHNKIHVLRPGLFDNLPNLETLNMSYNSIVHMTGGAFNGLISLTSLDLSFNNFYFMDGGLVKSLVQLEYLGLEGNHLRKFDINALLESKSNAVTLNVEANPLECEWLKATLIYVKYHKTLLLPLVNETYTIDNAEQMECFDSYKKFDYKSKNEPKILPDKLEDTRDMRAEVTRILEEITRQNDSASSSGLIVGMGVTVIILATVIFATYRIYNKRINSRYVTQSSGNFSALD